MNVSAIGNLFGVQQGPEKIDRKPAAETAGSLAFGTAETAGSLANNAGGSFCAMAQAKFSTQRIDYYTIGVEMNEIRIANYTLMTILLLVMSTFYTSINAMAQSNMIENTTKPMTTGFIR